MQSKTARIFGRSALIDSSRISLPVRLLASFGEKAVKFHVADPRTCHLVAESRQDLTDGRLARDIFREDGANVRLPLEPRALGFRVEEFQEFVGKGNLDRSRHGGSRLSPTIILPHGLEPAESRSQGGRSAQDLVADLGCTN